jgi:hypothetical protein
LTVVLGELLDALVVLGTGRTQSECEARGVNVVNSQALPNNLVDDLQRKPRADRVRSVADEHTQVVNLTGLASVDQESDLRALLLHEQVLVHATRRNERRERHAVRAGRAVREDDDLDAVVDRLARLAAHALERELVARQAFGLGERNVDGDRRPRGVRDLEALHRLHLLERDDRAREPDARALRRLHLEQVALGPDVRLERHDDALADWVDRGVRDLREELAEEVVDDPRLDGHACERRVVAHRPERLLARDDEREQEQVEVLDRVPERVQARVRAELGRVDGDVDRLRALDALDNVRELEHVALDPAREVLLARGRHLELAVVDDPALDGVDEEHASGLEPALLHDLLRRDEDGADLGRADHDVVVGDDVSAGAQAVAVQVCTAVAAVGEGEEGRPVPGLLQACRPVVERALLGLHCLVPLPGLGDEHHDCLGQGDDPVDGKELEYIVERGGIGTAVFDDRVQEVKLVSEQGRSQNTLSRPHPVLISPNSVNFT